MKFKNFFNKVIIPIIILFSLVIILVFPFLSNEINPLFAIISFGCSLFFLLIITLTSNIKDKKICIVTLILFYYIFISIFIIKYFNSQFNWLWFIFGLVIIGIPCILCLINYRRCNPKNKTTYIQEKNFKRNAIRYTLFYYVVDLFYMSFIVDNLICKYIFGGAIIIYIFYNSSKVFINNVKPNILAIIQDVFIGLGITIYLIFIIPDNDLRIIVTSIVSAIFGGYVTLFGVAWTIKDNSKNRKEDERQSKIPYLYIEKGEFIYTFKSFEPILDKEFHPLNNEIKHFISINEFIVKNSNNSDCVPCGFILNGKFYKFNNMFFIERNKRFNVLIAHNYILNSKQDEINLSIIVKDVLNNFYKFDCELKLESKIDTLLDNKHTPTDSYSVINLHLPQQINNLDKDLI